MDEQFRKELNEQTLPIIEQMLERHEGVILACMIRGKDGKQYNMLGYEITPKEFMVACVEACEAIKEGFDKMKKNTPKN